jgi:hypothetical protein
MTLGKKIMKLDSWSILHNSSREKKVAPYCLENGGKNYMPSAIIITTSAVSSFSSNFERDI